MGVKGDLKAVGSVTNGNATPPGKKGRPEMSVDTVPKRDYKDDVIEDLNSDLRKLQKSLTCVICLDMLFEPYSLQCGHVFCYTCMLDWLGQQKKRTCPECRDVVKIQPAPAYLIREMTETFVYRAELTSPHGSGAELRKQQREALKAVERDKASEGKEDKGGLFHGMFKKRKKSLRAMRDPEDGVLRCPECNWEVEDGFCDHCGRSVRTGSHHDGDFSDDDEDDDDSGSETESDREDSRHIPVWDDELDFDEDEEDEEDWEGEGGRLHLQRHRYGFGPQRHDDEDDEDDEDEDDDGRGLRDSSVSTVGGRNEPINIDDDSDLSLQVTYTNRRGMPPMRTGRRPPQGIISQAREQPRAGRRVIQESSEIEEESEDDEDEGSLADFVEHDTPENRRRPAPGRNGVGVRGFLNNGPMVISSSPVIAAPARRNTRRTVIDDEEDQSSVSEASPRPPPFRGEIRHDYTQRRGPIALPSDNDDDEVELLSGYTPLDYTASENEDDEFASPPARRGQHMSPASRTSGPGSVFSVPEEDEDEESRAFGDDDESEDPDGDVRMGGSEQRNERRGAGGINTRPTPNSQRVVRNRTRTSRPQVVEDDSDSDSDIAPAPRRRRMQTTGTRGNTRGSSYFRAHHRDSNGSSRQANSGRRQREIDPAFFNMFQQHTQAITERQLENLGVMNSSVSPARSATPVQRHYTGGSSRGSRSTRESTRELTPVQAMGQSSPPPPFSPMFQAISSSPASMTPNNPASSNPPSSPQVQSPRLGVGVRAGSESSNSQAWGTSPQVPRPVPITIGASPQASRVRSRNSRQQLRGSSSRSGLRVGSVTPTPTSPQPAQPSQSGTNIAAIVGRQQGAGPVLTAAASRGRRGIALTTEDIRARGEAAVRLRQQAAAAAGNAGLGRRSSRRDLSANTNSSASTMQTPLTAVGRIGSGNFQGTGRRLGAVIGGAPGGPMLIIGSEDDRGER